jgi:hypothetical protein
MVILTCTRNPREVFYVENGYGTTRYTTHPNIFCLRYIKFAIDSLKLHQSDALFASPCMVRQRIVDEKSLIFQPLHTIFALRQHEYSIVTLGEYSLQKIFPFFNCFDGGAPNAA